MLRAVSSGSTLFAILFSILDTKTPILVNGYVQIQGQKSPLQKLGGEGGGGGGGGEG